ncbi:MAG: hypothetical protein ACXWQR_00045 [Ktedonobacterales bacterium]
MLPANFPPVTCTRCGWQNEPTARMCGGCGMPLRTTDPGATSNVDLLGGTAAPALRTTPAPMEMASPSDAPTAYLPQRDRPQQAYVHPGPVITALPGQPSATPAVWAGPARTEHDKKRPEAHSRSRWWRLPLIALVVLGVLVGGALGVWATIIRPSVHAQVDANMRTSFNSAIEKVAANISQLPSDSLLQITVSASDVDQQIQQNMPAGTPLSDVHLHFADGGIQISYVLNGSPGTITTHLQANQGRLQAQATSVDYPLGFVESGDEMERAMNDAFARLPGGPKVLTVSINNDTLSLTVHT